MTVAEFQNFQETSLIYIKMNFINDFKDLAVDKLNKIGLGTVLNLRQICQYTKMCVLDT